MNPLIPYASTPQDVASLQAQVNTLKQQINAQNPPSLMQAKALKLARLIAPGLTFAPTIMASPPTLTLSAANAVSPIAGGGGNGTPTISALDSRLTPSGGLPGIGNGAFPTYISNINAMGAGATRQAGCAAWGHAFMFDGQIVAVNFQNDPAVQVAVRIRVDGQWHNASQYQPALSNDNRYLSIDFGSRATRQVEIFYSTYVSIFGYSIGATDRLWAVAPIDNVQGLFFGDSYVNGITVADMFNDLNQQLGFALGLRNMIGAGVSSMGWVQTDVGVTNRTFLDRITAGEPLYCGQMDIVVMHASVNDVGRTPATVQANVAAGTALMMKYHPTAFIFMVAAFRAPNANPSAAVNQAVFDGFMSVADPTRMQAFNGFNSPTYVSVAPAADANTAYVDNGDGIHPSVAGCAYLAGRMATDIGNWLRSVAAANM